MRIVVFRWYLGLWSSGCQPYVPKDKELHIYQRKLHFVPTGVAKAQLRLDHVMDHFLIKSLQCSKRRSDIDGLSLLLQKKI